MPVITLKEIIFINFQLRTLLSLRLHAAFENRKD